MTEIPDTAQIRAEWPHDTKAGDAIWALADALDAARTENRQLAYDKREISALFEADHDGWRHRAGEAEARAEAAEAERDERKFHTEDQWWGLIQQRDEAMAKVARMEQLFGDPCTCHESGKSACFTCKDLTAELNGEQR